MMTLKLLKCFQFCVPSASDVQANGLWDVMSEAETIDVLAGGSFALNAGIGLLI